MDTPSGMPVVSRFSSKAPGEVALAAHLYPLLGICSDMLRNALCKPHLPEMQETIYAITVWVILMHIID